MAPDIYRITSDHLGAPLNVIDDNGTKVWEWDGREPFGFQMPNQDPDGDSNYFYLNMRFAGQWFDYETGLYHNGFRDYHPKTGRYIQSDPIGLEGGWNTYAYTENNPVNFVDPEGLAIRGIYGDDHVQKAVNHLIQNSPTAASILIPMIESSYNFDVIARPGENKFEGKRRMINGCGKLMMRDPSIILFHELMHSLRFAVNEEQIQKDRLVKTGWIYPNGTSVSNKEEDRAMTLENIVAREMGYFTRHSYQQSQHLRYYEVTGPTSTVRTRTRK